jgi:hypothetical protein
MLKSQLAAPEMRPLRALAETVDSGEETLLADRSRIPLSRDARADFDMH